jgi:uncharacterized membrane protein YkgB
MKRILARISVALVIVILVFSPYFLIIDFERSAPFVLLVWLLSFTYFLFLKRRVDRRLEMRNQLDDEPENGEESNESL